MAVALGTTVLSMETTGQNKTSLESDVMRLLTYANLVGVISRAKQRIENESTGWLEEILEQQLTATKNVRRSWKPA